MRLRLIASEAVRSIGASMSTTVASTVTVLIGMFVLGLTIALGTWVLAYSNHVKKELVVKVYFLDSAKPQQINRVGNLLHADPRIKTAVFLSKTDALRIARKSPSKYPGLTDLAFNPFPSSYTVTPKQAGDVVPLAKELAPLAGVEKVENGGPTAKRILSYSKVLTLIFLIAVIVLLICATLLIANTIRLSIFARRREIEVMKLVGATNWFVRGPFMLEGLICGLVGSLVAVVLLLIGKDIALPSILHHVKSSKDARAMAFELNALIIVGTGILLGAAGSGLTVRRFLRI
jgi:cell division transport system permease protein